MLVIIGKDFIKQPVIKPSLSFLGFPFLIDYCMSANEMDFVVRDVKIDVYLDSPRKINFPLVSDFFSR